MPFFKTLRFKILMVYTLIITSFAVLLLYSTSYSMGALRKQLMDSTLYTQQLYTGRLDASLDDLRNYLISMLYQNPDMFDFGRQEETDPDFFPKIQRIQIRLDKDRAIYSIADLLFYFSKSNNTLIMSVGNQSYYGETPEALKTLVLEKAETPAYKADMWQQLKINGKNGFVRIVSDGTGNYIGAYVTPEKLFGFDKITGIKTSSMLVVLSREGDIILSSKPSDDLAILLKDNIGRISEQYIRLTNPDNGRKYLVSTYHPQKTDVLYASVLMENDAFEELPFLRAMWILIPVAVTLALLMFLFYLRQLLFQPIDAIMAGMKKAATGDLAVRLKQKGIPELKFLIDSFNDMLAQIKNLQIDVLDEQLHSKEAQYEIQKAELKYLQLQINPHFLANSLSIVYNLTLVNDLETIRRLTLHMAQYFRYSMKVKSSLVPLKQEIQFIEDYLAIQKIRFTRRLEYSIDLPDEFASILIPPMTLQPFVENCIVHSMVALEKPLEIGVQIASEGEGQTSAGSIISISIRDNGLGFSGESLENMNNPAFIQMSGDTHTGIWNVFYRLRLNFEERASLSFSNLPDDGGSLVRICIPNTNP